MSRIGSITRRFCDVAISSSSSQRGRAVLLSGTDAGETGCSHSMILQLRRQVDLGADLQRTARLS